MGICLFYFFFNQKLDKKKKRSVVPDYCNILICVGALVFKMPAKRSNARYTWLKEQNIS